jgi:succinate dehydrogenase / fumarate reductase flavoprotein subunit
MSPRPPEVQLATSVLVVGTGGSGLRAAVEVAERRVDVLAVGRRRTTDTYTSLAGDTTGLVLQRALLDRAIELRIPIVDSIYVTRLLHADGVVVGAYGFDLVDGTRYRIEAGAVILATGGHTGIWRYSSSRRDENVGDSFRLAIGAGARLRDPELVQFHPFGVISREHSIGALVPDAARDAGAILRNRFGERFMSRHDPVRLERSTSARVASAMHAEISEGRGTPNGGVWLDLSDLSGETTTVIEVAPAAHCSIGGIWVRPEDNGAGVDGLYAVGEAASGMHGANRLGGTSLAELLVDGPIVGAAAAIHSANLTARAGSAPTADDARAELDELVAGGGREAVRTLRRELGDTMTAHAGPGRDEAGLVAGLSALAVIEDRLRHVRVDPDIASPHDLAHAVDLKSSVLAARATLECALERRESRGCHQRYDAPQLDPSMQVNLVWSGAGQIEREPIPPIPADIAARTGEASSTGRFAE